MTLIRTGPDSRPALLLEIPDFRLRSGEPLAAGLKRLSLNEIEVSIDGFYDGEEVFELAVHEARKSTKRLRAMLRLVRSEVGEKVYRYENRFFREISRLLSDVRSASAVALAMGQIRDTYAPLLAEGVFADPVGRLETRRQKVLERAMEDPHLVSGVVARLEAAHDRFSRWPSDASPTPGYGIGIRDSFAAIGPGLDDTFSRGRAEMVAAYGRPTAPFFHSWRKRVKYLRYQMELLTPLWPEGILAMALALERVGELLGEDHDLAELVALLTDRPDLCPNPIERSLIRAVAQQRRSDLQIACRILGKRVFAETPGSLSTRMEAYWESSHEPLPESVRILQG